MKRIDFEHCGLECFVVKYRGGQVRFFMQVCSFSNNKFFFEFDDRRRVIEAKGFSIGLGDDYEAIKQLIQE